MARRYVPVDNFDIYWSPWAKDDVSVYSAFGKCYVDREFEDEGNRSDAKGVAVVYCEPGTVARVEQHSDLGNGYEETIHWYYVGTSGRVFPVASVYDRREYYTGSGRLSYSAFKERPPRYLNEVPKYARWWILSDYRAVRDDILYDQMEEEEESYRRGQEMAEYFRSGPRIEAELSAVGRAAERAVLSGATLKDIQKAYRD